MNRARRVDQHRRGSDSDLGDSQAVSLTAQHKGLCVQLFLNIWS